MQFANRANYRSLSIIQDLVIIVKIIYNKNRILLRKLNISVFLFRRQP